MKYFFMILALSISSVAFGSEFCAGFEEGWKTVRGEMSLVPMCPLEPLIPLGSTAYREGLKAGMRAAHRGY